MNSRKQDGSGAKRVAPQTPKRPSPYFQCFASDWIADEEYMLATLAERGLLSSIMNYCWVNGSIPGDPYTMANLLRVAQDEINLDDALIEKYVKPCPDNNSRLHCPELDRQKAAFAERREKLAHGGRKGGLTTQAKNRDSSPPLSQASSVAKAPEMNRDELNRNDLACHDKLHIGTNKSQCHDINFDDVEFPQSSLAGIDPDSENDGESEEF